MIVVDTSALMELVLGAPMAEACADVLATETEVAASAATLTEAFVVAMGRGKLAPMQALMSDLRIEVVALSEASARRAADAYARWGKGFHPAGLNFGDCFAYALAIERDCPLLYLGSDFAKTDIQSAL